MARESGRFRRSSNFLPFLSSFFSSLQGEEKKGGERRTEGNLSLDVWPILERSNNAGENWPPPPLPFPFEAFVQKRREGGEGRREFGFGIKRAMVCSIEMDEEEMGMIKNSEKL